MKKLQRLLLVLSPLLMIVSASTCYFGVQHEINKIPPETRAAMADFDWMGVEWIGRGFIIFLGANLAALCSLTLWRVRRGGRAQHQAP